MHIPQALYPAELEAVMSSHSCSPSILATQVLALGSGAYSPVQGLVVAVTIPVLNMLIQCRIVVQSTS